MAQKPKTDYKKIFLLGIFQENPVLRLVLGTCATLAVTTEAVNGIGMGLATTFVLVGSNLVISLIKDLIPERVRIPAYVTVIAGFVTIIQMLIQAFLPAINDALGIFLPLIVVNCIILARAEMFASKNPVGASIIDGLGMGLGFTMVLLMMGTVREILGNGTWFGITLTAELIDPMLIFILPSGGFFVFGCLMALMNLYCDRAGKKRAELSCQTCPAASACGGCGGCGAPDQTAQEEQVDKAELEAEVLVEKEEGKVTEPVYDPMPKAPKHPAEAGEGTGTAPTPEASEPQTQMNEPAPTDGTPRKEGTDHDA